MTLDDVAAAMRERFTPKDKELTPVRETTITAEEWNAMAQGITAADALEALLANPGDGDLEVLARSLIKRVRSGR